MLEKVKRTIEKYHLIEKEDKIVVAVSGGPDSISLLHILHELQYNICVAHMNHGLRENADGDEAYVVDFCQKRNIPCFVKKINLKEMQNKMTLEEAGRKERYQFFSEVMEKEKCNKIATAHNSNDNAETIMMNMIRGSGVSGLKGIEAVRGNIIRPLIEVTRKEIETYCIENQLCPRHDESNDEDIYTRNKIRLHVIPYIEKNINSNVVKNMNRLASIVSEEDKFIEEVVQKAYDEMIIAKEERKEIYSLKKFNSFAMVIRKRLIIKFIINLLGNAKDIEKVHIDDIIKLCENNIGGKFLMPNKNIKITVLKGKIECERMMPNPQTLSKSLDNNF